MEHTCPNCGADLREVGVYTKTYSNFEYCERLDCFAFNYDDSDGVFCGSCDGYVDVEFL